jgi:ABC-2 type transport system ATP-binding protein
MLKGDTIIKVENVSKNFSLPHERTTSIKGGIVHIFKHKVRSVETQHALRDVSFEVNKGDFFGIVGRNGSGKSTLLKIISEIYAPTSGKVTVSGKLVPFIELGVGFNPELTGKENVYLNGALLGFSRQEIAAQYDDIVSFAELGEFMDQKLKNYSSGMQVRLAFSVAIRANSDILILDEVLAVGDEAFQKKCSDFFIQAKENGKTIVLVTHSMEDVRKFCNRAILIEEGVVRVEGSPDKVASAYSKLFA